MKKSRNIYRVVFRVTPYRTSLSFIYRGVFATVDKSFIQLTDNYGDACRNLLIISIITSILTKSKYDAFEMLSD